MKFLLKLILSFSIQFWEGVATYLLWGWFIEDILATPINYMQAVGLTFVVGYLTYHFRWDDLHEPEKGQETARYAIMFVRVPIVIGMGWVLHLFM